MMGQSIRNVKEDGIWWRILTPFWVIGFALPFWFSIKKYPKYKIDDNNEPVRINGQTEHTIGFVVEFGVRKLTTQTGKEE
jgi:hypothetical protein